MTYLVHGIYYTSNCLIFIQIYFSLNLCMGLHEAPHFVEYDQQGAQEPVGIAAAAEHTAAEHTAVKHTAVEHFLLGTGDRKLCMVHLPLESQTT